MAEIGAFVLETACSQMRDWRDAGVPPLRMAVNVSLCQLRRGDFVDIVGRALAAYDVDPEYLELELSERGVVRQDPEILSQLHELKALGVRLAIDDFGTGDSAIAYLKELPIDTLKIDRSYVDGAMKSGRDAAIASAMVALAQRLELTVIAEGVERPEQLELVAEWGCDEYQGFHFSPAVPNNDFPHLLGGAE